MAARCADASAGGPAPIATILRLRASASLASAPDPMDTTRRIRAHFAESAQLKLAAGDELAPHIARAAALMTDCLLASGKILACGNGGSASDAQHFAAEMVGRFERE